MKHTSLLLAILFIGFSSFTIIKSTYKYANPINNLSIAFPGEFSVEKLESESANTTKVTASVDDQVYMLSMTEHQTEVSGKEMEELSLETFVEAVNGNIKSKSTWKSKKTTGTKAIIRMENEDVDLEYLIFFKNNIQYQLVVLAAHSTWNQGAANSFFKSLKIK